MIYDCIVAGAGPAGSLCAYLLAKAGYKCLILEKRPEIGEKICGGFLPNRPRKYLLNLGIDISEILKKDAARVKSCMTIKGKKEHLFTYAEEDFGIGAYRKTLDQEILDCALSKGAEICFGEEVREVQEVDIRNDVKGVREDAEGIREPDQNIREDVNNTWKKGIKVGSHIAREVIFATGACGHRKMNVFQPGPEDQTLKGQSFGISEIIRGNSNLPKDRVYFWYENEETLDYFWAIPISEDTWNTGFWCQKPDKNMKPKFFQLKEKYVGGNFTEYETLRVPTGAFCGNVNILPYMQGSGFGAGDFCGTNQYGSGEGLYYALVSAKETAERVMEKLKKYK